MSCSRELAIERLSLSTPDLLRHGIDSRTRKIQIRRQQMRVLACAIRNDQSKLCHLLQLTKEIPRNIVDAEARLAAFGPRQVQCLQEYTRLCIAAGPEAARKGAALDLRRCMLASCEDASKLAHWKRDLDYMHLRCRSLCRQIEMLQDRYLHQEKTIRLAEVCRSHLRELLAIQLQRPSSIAEDLEDLA